MKEIPELVQNVLATNLTKSQQKISVRTAIPLTWISALFKKFQIIYGSKWVSQIQGLEDEYIKEWSVGLAKLTGEQIKDGLGACRLQHWPPSMAEFVDLCQGERRPKINSQAYIERPLALRAPIDKAKGQTAINKMKLILNQQRDK